MHAGEIGGASFFCLFDFRSSAVLKYRSFHSMKTFLFQYQSLAVAGILYSCVAAQAQWGPLDGLQIDKPEDKEDMKSVPAPAGAIVLFDGTSLDGWTGMDGKSPAKWKDIEGGVLEVQPGSGNILSKQLLEGHFKLHVEFRIPYLPEKHGQERGNSGVYMQGRYEVQVLDAYHNDTYKDGMCGAIYTIEPPSVNAAKAPTVWQSYDIEFHSPKFADGKKTEMGTMTVVWNGQKVHDQTKLTKDVTVGGRGGDPSTPGPLMLQDHGSPVEFRNIWMEPLK